MSAARNELLTETDPPDGGDDFASPGGSYQPNLPPGISGSVHDVQQPQQRSQQAQQEPEFEIIETDSNGVPLNQGTQQQYQQDAGQGQQPRPDDASGEGQQGQGTGADDSYQRRHETRSARRERQRQGRERTLAENARLHAEIAELRARLDGVEPRLTEFDQDRIRGQQADIERQINEQAQRAAQARARIAQAMTDGDANALTAALDERDQAIIHGQQLLTRKNALARGVVIGQDGFPVAPRQPVQAQPQMQQPQARPLPAAAASYVQEFQATHPWFNPQNPDLDTQIILQIDNAVAREGFDPTTADYWDEIEDRARQYLPHRFGGRSSAAAPNGHTQANGSAGRVPQQQTRQQQLPPERRGPMIAGTSDRAPSPGPNKVYLSPERKEAMIEVGVLARDGRTVLNEQKFKSYMKKFQEFDRDNGLRR